MANRRVFYFVSHTSVQSIPTKTQWAFVSTRHNLTSKQSQRWWSQMEIIFTTFYPLILCIPTHVVSRCPSKHVLLHPGHCSHSMVHSSFDDVVTFALFYPFLNIYEGILTNLLSLAEVQPENDKMESRVVARMPRRQPKYFCTSSTLWFGRRETRETYTRTQIGSSFQSLIIMNIGISLLFFAVPTCHFFVNEKQMIQRALEKIFATIQMYSKLFS